jgi:hypothetical protein
MCHPRVRQPLSSPVCWPVRIPRLTCSPLRSGRSPSGMRLGSRRSLFLRQTPCRHHRRRRPGSSLRLARTALMSHQCSRLGPEGIRSLSLPHSSLCLLHCHSRISPLCTPITPLFNSFIVALPFRPPFVSSHPIVLHCSLPKTNPRYASRPTPSSRVPPPDPPLPTIVLLDTNHSFLGLPKAACDPVSGERQLARRKQSTDGDASH